MRYMILCLTASLNCWLVEQSSKISDCLWVIIFGLAWINFSFFLGLMVNLIFVHVGICLIIWQSHQTVLKLTSSFHANLIAFLEANTDISLVYIFSWLPWWPSGKEPACQCRRLMFNPWVGKIPWRRKWQPTPVFLPGKSHGQRSLAGYSPWDRIYLFIPFLCIYMYKCIYISIYLCFVFKVSAILYLLSFSSPFLKKDLTLSLGITG